MLFWGSLSLNTPLINEAFNLELEDFMNFMVKLPNLGLTLKESVAASVSIFFVHFSTHSLNRLNRSHSEMQEQQQTELVHLTGVIRVLILD